MAYNPANPPRLMPLAKHISQKLTPRIWLYSSADSDAVVSAPGYFEDGYFLDMMEDDFVWFIKTDGSFYIHPITSSTSFGGVVLGPAGSGGGSGGGGISAYQEVAGSSVDAEASNGYLFNGDTGAAKTLNLPEATGSMSIVEAVDGDGDAENNPITAVPDGSDVIIGDQDQIYTNYGTGGWRDIAIGYWARMY